MAQATARCGGSTTRGARIILVCACPALLLASACLLPFLNKAFLVDDPHFLEMARQILKSPLHPMNFDICWNIVPYCIKAYQLTPGNTLMGYALVPTVLGGGKEWIAHLTQLGFVWVAVLAMSSFVLRMGWSMGHAITGTLLLVAIPPLLPMASTAMPDVVALAVGLVGMERLAAWKEERKWSQGAVAAVALGLAGIARAHLVLLLPLAAFFLVDSTNPSEILRQIRQSPSLWFPVLAGGIALLAVVFTIRERGVLLSPPDTFTGLNHVPRNLRTYLLFLSFPLPLAVCWAVARWRPWLIALVILAASAATAWLGRPDNVMALIGCYVLTALLWDAWKSRNREKIFLGLWLLIPLPIVYYGHLPIKYLLPCAPAIILICFRLGSAIPAPIARAASLVLIIAGVAYSVLILRSDAEYADFGRDGLATLIRPHALAGEKVWFPNQFSAYWYAPSAGGELIVPGVREPKRGDLIVVGSFGGVSPMERYPQRTLVQTLTHRYRFGRTMGAGGGLYTNVLGNWLWTFRRGYDDRHELWRLD